MVARAVALGAAIVACAAACDVAVLPPPVTHTSLTPGLERPPPDDPAIVAAVQKGLVEDDDLPPNIGVTSDNGVVTLLGNVPDLLTKERAIAIAETILQVRAVVDRIALVPVERPNGEVRKDLENALRSDSVAQHFPLKFDVRQGVVTIEGTVDAVVARQLVLDVIKRVSGVREIVDRLRVVPRDRYSDDELQAEVRRRLEEDVWVDPSFMNVLVSNAVVILSGTVGSMRERAEAERDARIPGVRAIDSRALKIDTWVRRDRQRPTIAESRTDPELKTAVRDALIDDWRVYGHDATADAQQGVVTLTGIVHNLRAKQAAEEDARDTVGVARVVNLLEVRPAKLPTDAELAARLQQAFRADSRVRNDPITVSVFQNKVLLTGEVATPAEREEATRVAARTDGVIEVDNEIAVRAQMR